MSHAYCYRLYIVAMDFSRLCWQYYAIRVLLRNTCIVIHVVTYMEVFSSLAENPRRIFFLDEGEDRSFYKDLSSAPISDMSIAVELTNYMHPYQETLRDINYFDGILYWVKASYPMGIGIMTNYNQTNRSYRVQEIGQFQDPWRILITSIEP